MAVHFFADFASALSICVGCCDAAAVKFPGYFFVLKGLGHPAWLKSGCRYEEVLTVPSSLETCCVLGAPYSMISILVAHCNWALGTPRDSNPGPESSYEISKGNSLGKAFRPTRYAINAVFSLPCGDVFRIKHRALLILSCNGIEGRERPKGAVDSYLSFGHGVDPGGLG